MKAQEWIQINIIEFDRWVWVHVFKPWKMAQSWLLPISKGCISIYSRILMNMWECVTAEISLKSRMLSTALLTCITHFYSVRGPGWRASLCCTSASICWRRKCIACWCARSNVWVVSFCLQEWMEASPPWIFQPNQIAKLGK